MSATIKDIAKMVGVSPSTVSRVINGTAPISGEVTARIRDAMSELDYHPNARARSFATGVTNTAGLVMNASNEATFSNSFFNRSVFAIEKVLQEHAYNLLIANDNGQSDSQILDLVQGKKVDGLIIPSSSLDDRLIDFLQKAGFPFVVMGEPARRAEEVSWVDVDNERGAVEGTEELLNSGYQEVILIADDDGTVFSRNRLRGYRRAIQNRCMERVVMAHHRYEDLEKRLVKEVGELQNMGFLCSSNEIAFYTGKALKKMGKAVPEEAGIVTFDNYPLAEYMDPPFTAIDVDTYQLGEKAAEMLMESMHGKKTVRHQLIRTNLLVRESSARNIRRE
ncbi:MAG: LacI family DNA-binding transcriptional regulator [Lachnospiraceae bacterium]|nr:LacI family DNA-binding transcriptional regulator [Lachnospiraceae bacterium]